MIDDLGEALGEVVADSVSSGNKGCLRIVLILLGLGIAGFLVYKFLL